MNKHSSTRTHCRSHGQALPGQTGVTLVELLIAMLIGLFLVGGVLQVFSSSRQTYRVQDATSRMQESGRMALEVLSRDLRIAGFWGCVSNRSRLVNNLDPDGTGYVDYLNGGVEGTEGDSGDPDTLTVRSGIDIGLIVNDPYGPSAYDLVHITDGEDADDDAEKMVEPGDIVMVSDCSAGDIFQVTSKPDNKKLEHETGSGSPGNVNVVDPACDGGNTHCLSKTYGGDARVLMTQEITYTIAEGSEGQPALWRDSDGVNREFVDGIESLQVLYGEDIDGTLTANYYVPADEVVDMASVVSVRIAVVARSYDDNLTGGIKQNYGVLGTTMVATDDRLRQVYTSTIAVRNRL